MYFAHVTDAKLRQVVVDSIGKTRKRYNRWSIGSGESLLVHLARCLPMHGVMARYSVWAVLSATLMTGLCSRAAQAASSDGGTADVPDEIEMGASSTPRAYVDPPNVGFKDQSLQPPRAWYGGSILAVDVIALSVGIAGIGAVASDSSGVRDAGLPILFGAGLTYVLGGPIVHATHDRLGMTFASLGLRVGVPMGGLFLGAMVGAGASEGCTGDMCGLGGVIGGGVLGFGAGLITASVIDISLLAYEKVPESTTPQVALVPTVDPKKGSAGLSLMGTW